MEEFEWELKSNKTGEVVMKGHSTKGKRENIKEDKETDRSWRAVAISNEFVEFVRNSNGDELVVRLNDSGFSNFEIGEDYDIEASDSELNKD